MADYALDPARQADLGRIGWVDYAKGLCIVLVVMLHSAGGVEIKATEMGLIAPGEQGWLGYVVTFAQPFRMPDFFLISGLFLGLVISRSWLRYIDRKVVHFAYFYVLWLSIQFSFKSVLWLSEGMGIYQLIGNYAHAFVEPFNTLWFIYLLPIFFLVTRILVRIPWYLILAAAAFLEILPIHTGSTVIDEFAARYVYFFAGYALAQPIFWLAAWARQNAGKALVCLVIWAVVNGYLAFTPVGEPVSVMFVANGWAVPDTASKLPVVSLALGAAGAMAIICFCAICSRVRFAGILRYLGSHSIVVYLAFFLPMAISRELLLRIAPGMDIGTMSLVVLAMGVLMPMVAYEFIRYTGWFRFLFARPDWAWIDRSKPDTRNNKAGDLQPAE